LVSTEAEKQARDKFAPSLAILFVLGVKLSDLQATVQTLDDAGPGIGLNKSSGIDVSVVEVLLHVNRA
jgi:hypothetical protein